ncbi:MAG TPA: protein kinase [Anaeromyxobacteraceae bacterium]|nr:protein kinase [Anaeromyxobacteraceae bacterium]
MPNGLSGSGESSAAADPGPGRLSLLLQELARAPGEDLHRAWEQRLKPGDNVGRFEILREVGRGGFGVVYEALDRQLGRSVAFKTLRPARTVHELAADSILREAEAVARLDHPAIVTLYDVGHCPSGPYLVEEMLHGETLEQRLRGGPLPAREAVAVGLEVARGLAHAHGHGVLHRDLKPGNVLLTEDGRVKLLDFGLAHLLGTRGLHGAGTPAYMAPEQLRGEAVDARADVFTLGATLFEMLAGKPPFQVRDGRSTALDPETPPALPEGTPRALAPLVERCLSSDPARRPASGQAVVEELLAVQRELESSRGAATRRKALRLALALAGVALIVTAAIYFIIPRIFPPAQTAGASTALPSVAVLPFADLSPGKDQEYFADGVAEEILNALAHVEGLRVVGRTSSFSFKGKSVQVKEIGRQLNVRAVLEGSVRKEGDRVRVTAQLVNAADGYHTWSESYSRQITGIFEVQDDIARSVVGALKMKLAAGKGPGSEGRTTNPESYNYYLLGLQHGRQQTLEGARRSKAALEKALKLDPANAPAQAALATAILNLYLFSPSTTATEDDDLRRQALAADEELRRQAMAAAEKAVAMAPGLAEGYLVRGGLRLAFADWEGGRTDFERALALRPNDPRALASSGFLLGVFGRPTEGIALAKRAADLDPLSVPAWRRLARLHMGSGQLHLAQAALDRLLEIDPDSLIDWQSQIELHVLQGRPEAALSAARRLAEPSDASSTASFVRLQGVALAEHDLGHLAESDRALEKLISRWGHGAQYQIAQVYARRGDADRAFEWLDRAWRERDVSIGRLKLDPLLRAIRSDPRYPALLRRMNLRVD